ICRERCYVRQQCLAETLRAEQGRRAYSRYGIAGGLTPAERAVTKAAQTCGLLYLDDLAAARVSPSGWTQERLYEIFDERYT
ncbi:WhiB family transcriptional regulator, partial [Streptomyces sp. A73]|nr:WhiB family transcriptional regulator [Streptomyces sp. A73]